MIIKLRKKIILAAMLSVLSLLTLIMTVLNTLNFYSIYKDAGRYMSSIADNYTYFIPLESDINNNQTPQRELFSTYESRLLLIMLDDDNQVIWTKHNHNSNFTESDISGFLGKALQNDNHRGSISNYRYLKTQTADGLLLILMDCDKQISTAQSFLSLSCIISATGYAVVFFFVSTFSNRIIKPVIIAYDKQKQFITDSSHELRTPLSIISANTEVLELEQGESTWTNNIKNQIERMDDLTKKLTLLSRIDETEYTFESVTFNLSQLAHETALAFVATASAKDHNLHLEIDSDIHINANKDNIIHLISILLDNAIKYTLSPSDIYFRVIKTHKNKIIIQTENPVGDKNNLVDVNAIFDRFYRADSSRSSSIFGHGIGLSIAKAIVDAHNGEINATYSHSDTIIITAKL